MTVSTIRGTIDRRILVNYRIDPGMLAAVLPPPFVPKLVEGYGIGGICLIRLKHIRPRFLPLKMGIQSENAAHRIAVEWNEGGMRREGVYIPRRDTSSLLNVFAGGRLFPGVHHHATFTSIEEIDQYAIEMKSLDANTHVRVVGRIADQLPAASIFGSVAKVSRFFERGAMGFSATNKQGQYDGIELRCLNWHVEPLEIHDVSSSFFDDTKRFPVGTIAFDCALLMRDIEHEWHGKPPLCEHASNDVTTAAHAVSGN